jgi:transglutaminase-like putative cysteine protease
MAEQRKPYQTLLNIVLRHWERRLTLFLTGLFLMQFVRWFGAEDGGWLPITMHAVEYTLLLIFLLQAPVRIWAWLRYSLQLIVVLTVTLMVVDYQPVGANITSFAKLLAVCEANIRQLDPYVWFTMGSWLAFVLMFWWVKVKWRISFLVVVCVVGIAVRDSFSVNELWSETAIMIFCGLCLLVVNHFSTLKRKNPASWTYIAEYPGALALPVVLILGLTMLLGSLAPDVSNLLTDPYTMYKSWKGEVVEKIIKNSGSSSNAAPSASNTSSGYSRNDSNLGGGFDFDYSPVMKVDASQRSYWRGETRTVYTGSGWEKAVADRRDPLIDITGDTTNITIDPQIDASKLKTVEVKQTYTFEKGAKYPVFFGAYAISSLVSINDASSGYENYGLLLWSPKSSELLLNKPSRGTVDFPKSYSIVSQVPIVDEAGLRTVSTDAENSAALQEYLSLPETLPLRVKTLAQSITESAANPYDKVKAIEEYLKKTYPYTNKPNLKLGKSKDFVDRFLFEVKEGYCDYFSTAMAVMTRSIGVPARWVKGYASGISSVEEARQHGTIPDTVPQDLNGPDVYTVRNSNAHSWVEVYFAGWGWIPFEPTSGFVLPKVTQNDGTVPLPEQAITPAPAAQAKSNFKGIIAYTSIGAFILLVALTLWLLRKKLHMMYRRVNIVRRRKLRKASNLNEQLIHEFSRLLRYLRRKGFATQEHETAREMFERLGSRKGWLRKEVETLLFLFEKAKYSRKSVTPEEMRQASLIFKRLRQDM